MKQMDKNIDQAVDTSKKWSRSNWKTVVIVLAIVFIGWTQYEKYVINKANQTISELEERERNISEDIKLKENMISILSDQEKMLDMEISAKKFEAEKIQLNIDLINKDLNQITKNIYENEGDYAYDIVRKRLDSIRAGGHN